MPVVVPVKFAFASRDLWFDPQGIDVLAGDYAICSTERGTEIGLVTADPFDVPASELAAPLKPVLRVASDEDLDHADDLARMGEDAMYDFRRLAEQNELDMKPVGVEYLFGGEKAVFYFAAEDRVDFPLKKCLDGIGELRVAFDLDLGRVAAKVGSVDVRRVAYLDADFFVAQIADVEHMVFKGLVACAGCQSNCDGGEKRK